MVIFALLGPLFYQFVSIRKVALTLGQQSYKPEMRKSNAWDLLFSCWFGRSLSSSLTGGALRFLQVGIVPAPPRRGALSTQGCDQCASWASRCSWRTLGGPCPLFPAMRSEHSRQAAFSSLLFVIMKTGGA